MCEKSTQIKKKTKRKTFKSNKKLMFLKHYCVHIKKVSQESKNIFKKTYLPVLSKVIKPHKLTDSNRRKSFLRRFLPKIVTDINKSSHYILD